MFTIVYKGYFIHGYFAKPACRFHRETESPRAARSLHAAKCQITRQLMRMAP